MIVAAYTVPGSIRIHELSSQQVDSGHSADRIADLHLGSKTESRIQDAAL